MKKSKIAVIGLGSMGYGVAVSIMAAGHETYGFDVNVQAETRFRAEGGAAGDMKDIAGNLDAVAVVVVNATQMESVLFGENGIVPMLREGAVVIGCATVPPDFARKTEARCNDLGIHYVDAPISGGSAKAASGALTVMASGSRNAFAAAKPVLDAAAEKVFELGTSAGAGSAMKAVNQLLAGSHIAVMAEAMVFGMSQGIAPDVFAEVIPECAGSSWMLENRAPHIVAGDYAPHSRITIWPKDLGIVLEAAEAAGVDAPITGTVLEQYKKAVEAGLGDEDDAAIAKVYASNAGLDLPGKKS